MWVLSGERVTRRARALAIAEDERAQHRKLMQDYANDDYVKENFSEEFIANLNREIGDLSAEITRIRDRKRVPADRLGCHNDDAGGRGALDISRISWRSLMRLVLAYERRVASAAAHGRS